MNNLIRFPKNLNLVKDPKAFSNFCLNPLGLTTQKSSNFPKQQKVEQFCNWEMLVHRGEKPLENTTVVFKCDPKLAKPEIKQYLTKQPFKTRDFKKVYAVLKTEVEPFYQKVETM